MVGPVGVGKSSLLQCLLGELQPLKGSVSIEGKVSYASQDAWVFSATLRENILFGQAYKPAWYNSVIEACALDKVSQLCSESLDFKTCRPHSRLPGFVSPCITLAFTIKGHKTLITDGKGPGDPTTCSCPHWHVSFNSLRRT